MAANASRKLQEITAKTSHNSDGDRVRELERWGCAWQEKVAEAGSSRASFVGFCGSVNHSRCRPAGHVQFDSLADDLESVSTVIYRSRTSKGLRAREQHGVN
jgi:hypothetical protein